PRAHRVRGECGSPGPVVPLGAGRAGAGREPLTGRDPVRGVGGARPRERRERPSAQRALDLPPDGGRQPPVRRAAHGRSSTGDGARVGRATRSRKGSRSGLRSHLAPDRPHENRHPLEGENLMFNRRTYLQGTALAGTALTLAACGLDDGGGGDGGDGSDGGGEGGAVPFTIYTARDSELAEKVVEDFETAHPEWEGMATILTLGAQEALERVRAESSNPQGDIWWGGTRQQLSQGAADGVLAPAPQEVIDAVPEDYRDPEGLWVGEMLLAELFMINTEMISGDEIPADW